MAEESRMNFYRSFYDLTTLLPEEERRKVNTALLDFFFEGIEPSDLSESGMKVFNGCRGRITKSRINAQNVAKRYENNKSKATKRPTNEVTKGAPERERDIEIEENKYVTSGKPDPACDSQHEKSDENQGKRQEIIAYLNSMTSSHYRPNTSKTKSLINARLHEGFTVDDFKTVIDSKTQEWGADDRMSKYLRPETLFGTKFEGYLQAAERTRNIGRGSNGYRGDFTEYDRFAVV